MFPAHCQPILKKKYISKPGDIDVIKKPEGTGRTNIHKRLDYISDLKVFHKSRNSGGNQCSVDNGGCTNLCLAIPSGDGQPDYKCACPTHHKLNKDNLTCTGKCLGN